MTSVVRWIACVIDEHAFRVRRHGIAFDADGGLWVTEVTRNGIYRILPDGACHRLIEDPAGVKLVFPASVTFAGPDLRTVLVGSIRATRLATFRSPVAGAALAHW